ncbi:hypothetical protein D3C72_558730 [compost metagenome]
MQAQRGVRIFGDGFHGDTANFIQRFTANHRTRAAKEGGIPHVVPVLHQPVEQRAFVRRFAKTPEVALERVRREEVVRRLHHRQLFLFEEPAHGHLQERARRDVVAVKNRHEFARGILQRVVDVPGFGVLVGSTGDVFHPHAVGELAKLFAPSVVQNPDSKLVFRPVDTERGVDGVFHHVQIFVIGRNENIHRRPLGGVFRQRNRLAIQRPDHLEIPQHQHYPRVSFREQQDQTAGQAHRVIPVQRRGIAPPDVAAGDGQGEHNQHQRREAPRNTPHQQGHAPQQNQEDKLRQRVKRLSDTEQRQNERENDDHPENKTPQAGMQMPQLFMRIEMAGLVAEALRQCFQPLMVTPAHVLKATVRAPARFGFFAFRLTDDKP